MSGRNTPPIGTVRPMVAHPAVLARIDAALARVRSGRISGCAHLERHPVATLCIAHPANAAIGIVRLYGWAICPACREQVTR